jgi:hypothetical protein
MLALVMCFFFGFVCAGCLVADVAGCDAFAISTASEFTCTSEDQCWSLFRSQLAAIAPSDWDVENSKGIASIRTMWYASCKENDQCFSSNLFMSLLSFARISSSVQQANSSVHEFAAKSFELDNLCGRPWAINNCDENGCVLNQTCVYEAYYMLRAIESARWRLFYALRREAWYLQRLAASCATQGTGVCGSFVSARQQGNAALQLWLRPSAKSNYFLFLADAFARHVTNRTCDGDLPCLASLVDPVLNAPDLVTAAQAVAATKTMLATKVASPQFETELFTRMNMPLASCDDFAFTSSWSTCKSRLGQVSQLSEWMSQNLFESRLTKEIEERIWNMLSSCWLDCNLVRQAHTMSKRAEETIKLDTEFIRRYTLVLCDTSWCLQAWQESGFGFVWFFFWRWY